MRWYSDVGRSIVDVYSVALILRRYTKLLQRRRDWKHRCSLCCRHTAARSRPPSPTETCTLPRLRAIDAAHKHSLDAVYQQYRHSVGLFCTISVTVKVVVERTRCIGCMAVAVDGSVSFAWKLKNAVERTSYMAITSVLFKTSLKPGRRPGLSRK